MDATDEGGTDNRDLGASGASGLGEPTTPLPPAGTYGDPPIDPTPPWSSVAPPGDPTGQWSTGWAPPPSQWAPPRRPHRRSAALAVVLAVAALLFVGAGVAIGYGVWTGSRPIASIIPRPTPGTAPVPSPPSSGAPSDAAAIAAKVDPAIVDINTTLGYEQLAGAGTGIVLTPNGEVLTNNHVIVGATKISVRDVGNGQTYNATVVGYDVVHDVAILQLQNASGLRTVTIGNSANVSVGESVVAIGNAQGAGGTPSYAGGSVTSLNQTITANDELTGSRRLTGLMQSNAYTQPGDSGGPVVTPSGKVVAITAAAAMSFGFGAGGSPSYSIPINTAVHIASEIEGGRASSTVHIGATAFLGVQVESSGGNGIGALGPGFGQQAPQTAGVTVAGVLNGEPASQVGIATGDVITKVDGTSVNSPSDLTAALLIYHPGGKVQIQYLDQSGQTHSVSVQLANGPPQ
jgi:S1-C subfamily serine protease